MAIYTYDAAGQRTVKYNWDRLDIFSNAHKVAEKQTQHAAIPQWAIGSQGFAAGQQNNHLHQILLYRRAKAGQQNGEHGKFGTVPQRNRSVFPFFER